MYEKINSQLVGQSTDSPYIIAEIGVNHNGSIDLAKTLIDHAKVSGADAVKFQSFSARLLNRKDAPKAQYHIETTGSDEVQTWYELLVSQEITEGNEIELFQYCQNVGIDFLSTPYDIESANRLIKMGVQVIKIASCDINFYGLIDQVIQKKTPLIISTGMSDYEDVVKVYKRIHEANIPMAILQCTSSYPCQLEDAHLKNIPNFKNNFDVPIGFSDHTNGMMASICAFGMGARIFEKHLTFDKEAPGPDHRASIDPSEFHQYVKSLREAGIALGSSCKQVLVCESENQKKMRRSLVFAKKILAGEEIKSGDLIAMRPGFGISPDVYETYLGAKLLRDVEEHEFLESSQVRLR